MSFFSKNKGNVVAALIAFICFAAIAAYFANIYLAKPKQPDSTPDSTASNDIPQNDGQSDDDLPDVNSQDYIPPGFIVTFGAKGGIGGKVKATICGDEMRNCEPFESGSRAPRGYTITFGATPDTNYSIFKDTENDIFQNMWEVNGELKNEITYLEENYDVDFTSFSYEVVENAHIAVEFEKTRPVTIKFSLKDSSNGGSLQVDHEAFWRNCTLYRRSEIESGASVPTGTRVSFYSTPPSENHSVKEWKINGLVKEDCAYKNDCSVSMEKDTEVTAEFALIPHITLNLNLEKATDGIMTAKYRNRITDEHILLKDGESIVPVGSRIDYNVSPPDGYRVKAWKVDGKVVKDVDVDTDSNLERYDITVKTDWDSAKGLVEIELEPIPFIKLTFGSAGNIGGKVKANYRDYKTKEDVHLTSGDTMLSKTYVNFTAMPDSNYNVKHWKNNGDIVNFSYDDGYEEHKSLGITVPINTDIIVEFVPNPKVTFGAANNIGGKVVAERWISSETYEQFASGAQIPISFVLFTAKPDKGYFVKCWKQDGKMMDGSINKYEQFITENANITVEFAKRN